jgi:hypothetical protein
MLTCITYSKVTYDLLGLTNPNAPKVYIKLKFDNSTFLSSGIVELKGMVQRVIHTTLFRGFQTSDLWRNAETRTTKRNNELSHNESHKAK